MAGKSPRQIAAWLNADNIPAPRGAYWSANTINGDRKKGTGILRVDFYRGRLRHGGNPVLRWCEANAVIEMDPAGSRKLAKQRSTGRIDGLVALTMAVRAEAPIASIYERERPEGFLWL